MRSFIILLLVLAPLGIFAQSIGSEFHLRRHIYVLSSEEMEGRETAKNGQKLAAFYLTEELMKYGLQPGFVDSLGNKSWEQHWHFVKRFGDTSAYFPTSSNVMALLPATVPSDEYVVLSAHYDHLGLRKGELYGGADDNGSGTSMLLELARAWSQDSKERTKNLLFVFFSGEEKGLLGSKHFAEYPFIPMNKIVANINIDMVGRADSAHASDSNYLYVIGSDKINPELDSIVRKANTACCGLELDYMYNNEKHPDRLYYRSDHYNFAKHGVPVVFFFSGLHADYHKPGDTADKINSELLLKRMQLVWTISEKLVREGLPEAPPVRK